MPRLSGLRAFGPAVERWGCEDLCGFQHANAAVGTGATRWRRASSPPAAGAAAGTDGNDRLALFWVGSLPA